MKTEKLQKVLARIGLASRRHIEQWIVEGRIKLNHRLARLGDRVDDQTKIYLDDRLIRAFTPTLAARILMYNKPRGQLCTRSDPQQRATVFCNLPPLKHQRWVLIGRLDLNTSGLLLIANDGLLAHRLLHPSSALDRVYAVRILGTMAPNIWKRLQTGVFLEDGLASFTNIQDQGGSGANHWYHVTLRQGRNRLVRRLFQSQGLSVNRLIRIRFGNIDLPRDLPPGQWRDLSSKQIEELVSLLRGGRV